MKKTDLEKNRGLAISHKIKNSTVAGRFGSGSKAKDQKDIASANPLLASLLGKVTPKKP